MGKSTKTQCRRDRMRLAVRQFKQTTFDNLPGPPEPIGEAEVHGLEKRIEITELSTVTREDELSLEVGFRLLPSRTTFSRIAAALYFDNEKLKTTSFRMLQGPLATDESQFTSVFDMRGIDAGSYVIKVEMYEPWGAKEKPNLTSKQITIDYVPVRREDRFVKIPIIKNILGSDLVVVSGSAKKIYREIKENIKKELLGKRDGW